MAGLVPAIHVLGLHMLSKNVDAIGARSDAVLRTALPGVTARFGSTASRSNLPVRIFV